MNFRTVHRLAMAVAIVPLLAIAAWFAKTWLTVDRCLDRGGRWDAVRGRCEGDAHP